MVIQKNKILAIILTVLTVIPFIFGFFESKLRYLYSRFIFDENTLILILVSIIVANAVLLGILFLCRNSSVLKVVVLMPIILITMWSLFVVSGLSTANLWKSETKDFENFSGVDYYLENEVKVAGLTLGEIISTEVDSVEDFEYGFQSRMLHSKFKLKGKFIYSEESYKSIKQAFLSDAEFTEVKYTNEENVNNMTWCFKFNSYLPEHQTHTSVDEWETLIIQFDDNNFCFYFYLEGGYDT